MYPFDLNAPPPPKKKKKTHTKKKQTKKHTYTWNDQNLQFIDSI